MFVHNLPPTTGSRLGSPSASGWDRLPVLEDLPRSLLVPEGVNGLDEIKSVPDPYARIRLFGEALFDSTHSGHAQAVARWRGLLGLIALQHRYARHYDLRLSPIELNGSTPLRKVLGKLYGGSATGREGRAELLTLSAVLPGERVIPLGLLTERTLIAGGRGASRVIIPGVPWLAGGLSDPTESESLSPDDAFILSASAKSWAEAVRPKSHQLAQLLVDFANAAVKLQDGVASLRPSENRKFAGLDGVLACLRDGFDIQPDSIGATESDCVLASRTIEGVEGIILADPAVAAALGKPATRVRLFGHHLLSQFDDNASTIRSEAARAGWLVVTADDLLLPDLSLIDPEVGKAAAHNGAAQSIVLPLTPLALLVHRSRDEAVHAVDVHPVGAGHRVTLSLALASGRGGKVELVREYATGKTVKPPEDLTVWPDFEADDWPHSFVRYEGDPRNDALPRFGFTPQMVEEHIARRRQAGGSAIDALAQWARDGARLDAELLRDHFMQSRGFDRFRSKEDPTNRSEQQQIAGNIEAIFLNRPDGSPAGAVLVRRKAAQVTSMRGAAAIDFGTSNSIVQVKLGDRIEKLDFTPRVHLPIAPPDPKRRRDELGPTHLDFFPLEQQTTPLPTLGLKRETSGRLDATFQSAMRARTESYGLDFNIFMPPAGVRSNFKYVAQELIGKQRLLDDLKWGAGSEGRLRIKWFFRQFMLMVAAELRERGVDVSALRWFISFPRAFDEIAERHFRAIVEQALAETGLDGKIQFATESDAALRYFTQDAAFNLKGASRLLVMLDVGGGTTDMAIWLDDHPVWGGSVRLAGRNFFRDVLARHPRIVSNLKLPGDGGIINLPSGEISSEMVDLVVADHRFTGALEGAWPTHAGDPDWALLRRCGLLALGGVLHIVGLATKSLLRNGRLSPDDVTSMTVALGGRGSGLFATMNKVDRPLAPLARMIADAAGVPIDVEGFRFSREPKVEVARGLLLGADSPARAMDEEMPLGLGVQLRTKDGPRELPAEAPTGELQDAEIVRTVDMASLQPFVASLKAAAGLDVRLPPATIEDIVRRQLSTAVAAARRPQVDDDNIALVDGMPAVIEPPLVMVLRTVIRMAAEGDGGVLLNG